MGRQNQEKFSGEATDKRVIKTKRVLRDSLLTLLEQKPVKQITITELTRLAEVNRSTFYFYYKDIYDMVEKTWNEIYETVIFRIISNSSKFTSTGDYSSYIHGFLEFCQENERLSKALIKSDIGRVFTDRIITDIRNNIPDSAKYYANDTAKFYLTTFALNGIFGTVLQWIRDGMRVPARELAVFLSETYFLGAKHQKERR